LGTADDDVYAAFYRDGKVTRLVDEFERPAGPAAQTELRLTLTQDNPITPGDYNLILRVNGQQPGMPPGSGRIPRDEPGPLP
jgi:hypothetical protein